MAIRNPDAILKRTVASQLVWF